ALSGLPGLELDPAAVRAVLDDPDPVEAGLAQAAQEARAPLAPPRGPGVNTSALSSSRGYEFAARIKAELAVRIREDAVPAVEPPRPQPARAHPAKAQPAKAQPAKAQLATRWTPSSTPWPSGPRRSPPT